jgi:fermentation-respiration switch protein FrsA (DUF1100 family)
VLVPLLLVVMATSLAFAWGLSWAAGSFPECASGSSFLADAGWVLQGMALGLVVGIAVPIILAARRSFVLAIPVVLVAGAGMLLAGDAGATMAAPLAGCSAWDTRGAGDAIILGLVIGAVPTILIGGVVVGVAAFLRRPPASSGDDTRSAVDPAAQALLANHGKRHGLKEDPVDATAGDGSETRTLQRRGPGEGGMGRAGWLIGLLLVTIVVALVAYLGAAVIAYDRISRVEADCGGRFPGFTPAAWSTDRPASRAGAVELDPAPYLVTEYEEVRLPSRDPAIELHAWWLPSREGPDAPVVVIIPGRGSCIRDPDSLLPAGMLHRLGYGVMLLDLRDHGGSTVEDGRYAGGTEEYRDVQGAVDWLVARGVEPCHIGVLGTSMGAATAIIAGGQDERIAAVWEDSSYADMERRIAEELEQQGYPRLLAPAAVLVARLVSGDDLASHTVAGELANLGGRHLFITHGAEDEATYVAHAMELDVAARSAGVLTDLWIVPEAGHTDAMFLHPAEYEERLAGFFGSGLESGPGPSPSCMTPPAMPPRA